MTTTHIDLIDLYRSFAAHAAPGESRLELFGGTGGKEIVKVIWDGPAGAKWTYCMSLGAFREYAGSAEVGRWLAGKLREALASA